MEWKLFDGDVAEVSTAAFHAGRARARHLEQDDHRPRLLAAAAMLTEPGAGPGRSVTTLSDLGCGDGGLLSLVQDKFAAAWGYDFCPANAEGWAERRVTAAFMDVFGWQRDCVRIGHFVAMTEVLEHLTDPHRALRWIRGRGAGALVCSSPWTESAAMHAAEHAWAWDERGYEAMLKGAGWRIARRELAGPFQVVLAR